MPNSLPDPDVPNEDSQQDSTHSAGLNATSYTQQELQKHSANDDIEIQFLEEAPVLSREQMLKLQLRKANKRLKKAETLLLRAEKDLKRVRDSARIRNICPICKNIIKDPHTVRCGHSFCASCISIYGQHWRTRKRNVECPECNKLICDFTPTLNFHAKEDNETMRSDQGLDSTEPAELNWPQEFKTVRGLLPFIMRN